MLGDVSGKAAPAALFAALVSGIMRSAAAQQPDPAQMLATLNDALQERKLESQYVTLLFALWNDENQTLQVANSGAIQPVYCRRGQSSTVKAEGFPLGMFPDVSYDELHLATEPGDAIVFVRRTEYWMQRTRRAKCMRRRATLQPALRTSRLALGRHCRRDPGRCIPLPGRARPLRRRDHHCAAGTLMGSADEGSELLQETAHAGRKTKDQSEESAVVDF